MIKRQNGGGTAAFGSPIASRQCHRQSQSWMRRELVSMEMTLEWWCCLLIAQEATQWAVGQAHQSGHTHSADISTKRDDVADDVCKRARLMQPRDADITGNYIMSPNVKRHIISPNQVTHANRTATQHSQLITFTVNKHDMQACGWVSSKWSLLNQNPFSGIASDRRSLLLSQTLQEFNSRVINFVSEPVCVLHL